MTEPHEVREELADLLAALCDDRLDATGEERLAEMLRQDAAARAYYHDYLCLHATLHWDQAAGQRAFNAAETSTVAAPPAPAIVASPWLLAGVAAATCAITLAAVRLWNGSTDPPDSRSAPPVAAAFPSDHVATLVATTDCKWAVGTMAVPASERVNGARLAAGDVHLLDGLAEIVFDNGARVVLQGPARFSPQSERGGILHFGKLSAHVPSQITPFVVQTGSALCASAGGSFEVLAGDKRATEVHVADGRVRVTARTTGALTPPSAIVSTGEALQVRLDASPTLRAMAADLGGFDRELSVRQERYPQGLVSYWSFDEQGGPAFDRCGNNHGVLQGLVRARGLVGRGALECKNADGQSVSLGSDETESFKFTTGLSIEALVVSRWSGKRMDYDEIFRKEDGYRRVLFSLQNDDDRNASANPPNARGPVLAFGFCLNGRYSELDLVLDGAEGRPSLADLVDARVHHLVATYDSASGQKSIWVDGRRCASVQFPPGSLIESGGSGAATIGNAPSPWEGFHGTIDEVAVYNRAIDEDEIVRHWENAKRGRSYYDESAAATTQPEI